MEMKITKTEGTIIYTGARYKDGSYFKLNKASIEMIDERAEEICIVTRLLSLSSNKKFSASKQELKNDLVKGKDNYPRTIPAVLNFIENHSLASNKSNAHIPKNETAFVTDGDKEGG